MKIPPPAADGVQGRQAHPQAAAAAGCVHTCEPSEPTAVTTLPTARATLAIAATVMLLTRTLSVTTEKSTKGRGGCSRMAELSARGR